MGPSKEEIECWRAPAVTKEILGQACTMLLREGIGRHGDGIAMLLAKAAKGDAEAAYALTQDDESHGMDQDEVRGWLWVAACAGHAPAATDLANLLASEAGLAPNQAEARALLSLSREWHGVGSRRKGRDRCAEMPAGVPKPASAGQRPADGPPEPLDGIVVVGPIGDASSREGLELTRRFGNVSGKRLALGGRLPRPLEALETILAEYPWAVSVAQLVEAHFAVLRRARDGAILRGEAPPPVTLPNLLLVGGKGAGKSTLASLICRIAGLASTTLPCGGVSDAAGIAPVTRSWSTTRPGAVVQAMERHRVANPALVLEEIDKATMTGSQNGSVAGALLSMVAAETFHDSSLMADVDVRAVTFLATANDLSRIDVPLRDRFEVVHVPSPGVDDLPVLARTAKRLFCEKRRLMPEMVPDLTRAEHAMLRTWFLRNGRSAREYGMLYGRLVSNAIAREEASAEARVQAISDPHARFVAMGTPTGLLN